MSDISDRMRRTEAGPISSRDVKQRRDGGATTTNLIPPHIISAEPQQFNATGTNERKKKTRRRKPKRKNPYNKQVTEHRLDHNITDEDKSIYARKQPVAPYNSNRFLIEDHNDLRDLDVELLAATQPPQPARPARIRDSSFTSADSDEDFFYSSPEDEEEFLTKEFSNTYQDLHVESLTQMTKSELVQHVLQLEERVDALEKRLDIARMRTEKSTGSAAEVGDRISQFQEEISTLALANEELQHENEKLKLERKCSSVSSVDSESDSSSSSGSSASPSQLSPTMSSQSNHHLPPLTNGSTHHSIIVDSDSSMDTHNPR